MTALTARLGELERRLDNRERLDAAAPDIARRLDRLDRRTPVQLPGEDEVDTADTDAGGVLDVPGLRGELNHLLRRIERLERDAVEGAPSRRPTFVTSISPMDLPRQERAIRSWLEYGDVVSLNGEAETASISALLGSRPDSPLHEITFETVERTAVDEVGRPFVYLDSFFDHIERAGGDDRAFVIINSDIIVRLDGIVEDGVLTEPVLDLLATGPVFGSRIEVDADRLEPIASDRFLADGTYFWGFDYFVLTAEQIAGLGRHGFIFGQPWWDYYLPHHLVSRGRLTYLDNPVALHVEHATRWNTAAFDRLSARFADYCVGNGHADDAELDAPDVCRAVRRRATIVRLPDLSTTT